MDFLLTEEKNYSTKIKIGKYMYNFQSSHWILMEVEVLYYKLLSQASGINSGTFPLDSKGALQATFIVIQIFRWMFISQQFFWEIPWVPCSLSTLASFLQKRRSRNEEFSNHLLSGFFPAAVGWDVAKAGIWPWQQRFQRLDENIINP